MKKYLLPVAVAIFASPVHASCGSAFCTVNTAWDTQGLASGEGWRVGMRYSYAKADKLRAGSSKITPEEPSGSDEEIENKRTINQVLNLDADYTLNARWNIALGLPLIRRDHAHTMDSSVSGPFEQQAKFTEVGDIKVVGSYRLNPGSLHSGSGIRFGLKLPTGATNKKMSPPDPTGDPLDPTAPHPLDRSSQPGSGSTDAILGAYYFQNAPGSDWGWFVSGQVQSAIATRDNYRPGSELSLDLGTHYEIAQGWTALLQLNAQHRERDHGSNANPASGGYSLHLSPGLSYALSPQTRVYGIVQIALVQYANADPATPGSGQLTAPWSFSAGLSHHF
ncbi:MAG: hypothetical protein WAV95_15225 [Azonexus sp.]